MKSSGKTHNTNELLNEYIFKEVKKINKPRNPIKFLLMREGLKLHCSLTSSAAVAWKESLTRGPQVTGTEPEMPCQLSRQLFAGFKHTHFHNSTETWIFVYFPPEINDENISGELEITRRKGIISAGAGMTVPA